MRVWDLASGRELATLVDPSVAAPSVAEPKGGEVSAISGLALSADERFLAVVTGHAGSSSVSVWDTGSWKLVKALSPAKPRADAASVVVARDGRSVFVAYHDSTILEWDVAGRFGQPAVAPTRERLDELWRDLGDPTGKGYAAAWELLDHPAAALRMLKAKLAPVPAPDAAAVRELVRKLEADSFREREDAGKRLAALGDVALPIVREAARGKMSPEGKERADRVIAALTGGRTADQLRHRRAVAVLEWIGRPEADEQLRALAGGAAGARLTAEARAALGRRPR